MLVLLIGENIYDSKSGVVTVMRQLLESNDLKNHIKYKTIFTTGDEYKFSEKIIGWSKAYVKFLYFLPKCNIIHIHHAIALNFWLTAVLMYIAKAFNKKVILHNHAADFHLFYSRCTKIKRRGISTIFTSADINIVLSTSWLKWYSNIAPKAKWSLLPNSIELPINCPPKNLDSKEIRMIYLARIEERKGLYNLINIMPAIAKEYSCCKLYIAGQGDLFKLKNLIKINYLDNNVIIMGHLNNKQKDDILRKSHLLLLPSYNEGLPMALLEAMSYGVVPVTSPVGGIPDVVISGKNGLLIEPGDEKALFEGIRKLLNDNITYNKMSYRARERVTTDFNLQTYIKNILSIYMSLYLLKN